MKAKKKNPESVALDRKTIEFIAPASFFKGIDKPLKTESPKETSTVIANQAESTTPIHEVQPESQTTPENEVEEKFEETIESEIKETSAVLVSEPKQEIALEQKISEPIVAKKIEIKMPEKRVSGLSISSLKAKKEHELNKKDTTIDESQLPNDEIVESVMQGHWADFVQKIDNDGRKILASNLHSDIPILVDKTTLSIQLPNDTMKKEVEREQYDLIEYLKLKLNNHFISLKITVNEEAAKKFAFTPEEKYEKLREKNPVIDLLRKEFDLDL